MVDYSRFDKLAKELSDDDDDAKNIVNVTKLDKPMAVTVGGEDRVHESGKAVMQGVDKAYSKWEKWSKDEEIDDDERKYFEDDMRPKPVFDATPPLISVPSSKTGKLTLNGSDNGKFLWSQTADEVEVRVRCDTGIRAKDVRVDLNREGMLRVSAKGTTVLEGKLKNAVWDDYKTPFASEEEQVQKAMAWEVCDMPEGHRCVLIRLVKRPPYEGMKIWWPRVFSSGEEVEVDVSKIPSRNQSSAASFQQAWKQAHETFLANRAKEREGTRNTPV
jgi:hypothetical protein